MYYLHFPIGYVVDGSPYNAVGPFKTQSEAHRWYDDNCTFEPDRWGQVTLSCMIHPDDTVE